MPPIRLYLTWPIIASAYLSVKKSLSENGCGRGGGVAQRRSAKRRVKGHRIGCRFGRRGCEKKVGPEHEGADVMVSTNPKKMAVLAKTTAVVFQDNDHSIGSQENRQIFADNWLKSHNSVIITLTPSEKKPANNI
jgi:hypothetical protein